MSTIVTRNGIGNSQRRLEDFRFLTGHGQYIDDKNLENQVYGMVLRSPEAHADITSIDASEALALDGVLAVITGEDWKAAGYCPIPTKSAVRKFKDGSDLKEPPHHPIAIDRVRYVGQPVAMVIAESLNICRDALELIAVEYASLPAVSHQSEAIKDGAPQIWDIAPNNICLDFELGDEAAQKEAFAKADHIISLDLVNNRVTAVPMEPRGALASYDSATGKYTLWNSSQNIHANRDTIADAVLKIGKENLHHIAPDVGGGFGAKNAVYQEPILILHACKLVGRPVKWINDRAESFLSDTHGRDQVTTVQLALDNDGTFRGLRTETVGNLGAFCATVGPFTPTGGSSRTQGGPYHFDAIYYTAIAPFTNTCPLDPYRGAGRPEGSYQMDRIIDYAAAKLRMDPIELRRKNLIPVEDLPMKSPMGLDIDCGNFPEVFEMTLQLSDREGYAERVKQSEAKGLKRGFGVSMYLECTGGGPKEEAKVSFREDGKVELSVGSSSTGMGHETAFAQVLAGHLGLAIEDVVFRQADTDATAIGGGHGGSRGMEVGGSAVLQTSREIVEVGKKIAAHRFDVDAEKVDFSEGRFHVPGTNHTMTMRDAIDAQNDPDSLPDDLEPGAMNISSVFERAIISIPNGGHAAEVEVDPATGTIKVDGYWVIDDFGTIINPMLADGQVMGGIAQGLGQALMENIVYDESGQLVTGSLMDYALPRADDMPKMVIGYFEGAPTKKNLLGVKGAGEAGCVGAPPAIVNAVCNALKDLGVHHIDMPLTPERVWRAIEDAKA
ncbi:MAG: xanthine dehydrogenase family protein molybdopterin-binding subunit [Rhodospirillales bacterium]|nr:xanthine dehydrogenase family protein molybdopterin-binding subunit [Rhodospirillales bacterium]